MSDDKLSVGMLVSGTCEDGSTAQGYAEGMIAIAGVEYVVLSPYDRHVTRASTKPVLDEAGNVQYRPNYPVFMV